MKYDYIIIDPSYIEFNRGGYGYLPYILYCSLKEQGYSVKLYEDFTMPQLKTIDQAEHYYIALWAYPQMDLAILLNKFLEGNFSFFGYYPLIEHLNLTKYTVPDEFISEGIINYPKYFDDFKYLLLCEDDMHLSKYEGTVYPLFTSYGCPNKCAFCPLTVNCNYKRIEPSINSVKETLQLCYDKGIMNIHFTDDDFFHDIDRTYEILQSVSGKRMKFIALATVTKLLSFLKKYGEQILVDSGIKIVEVGFETASEDLASSMGKAKKSKYVKLANSLKEVNIFWLTLTFFPGETIKTLNETGKFLKKYGHKPTDLYSRIATNSTEGGLGQFMQFYHGIKNYDKMIKRGMIVSDRPVRLLPSFIPYSFMNSLVTNMNICALHENKFWFDLYKIDIYKYKYKVIIGRKLFSCKFETKEETVEWYIFCAICARLGILE